MTNFLVDFILSFLAISIFRIFLRKYCLSSHCPPGQQSAETIPHPQVFLTISFPGTSSNARGDMWYFRLYCCRKQRRICKRSCDTRQFVSAFWAPVASSRLPSTIITSPARVRVDNKFISIRGRTRVTLQGHVSTIKPTSASHIPRTAIRRLPKFASGHALAHPARLR